MVKTTKNLLIFLQTFEGNVGKKIFLGAFVGKEENRKGAIKPWPLCTPLGLFLGVLGCGGVRLLTCVCMLRCWMCEVEPMYVDADGEASCCRLVEDFFIFCLRRGGGYMYS